jgi:G3E family GTPase
VLQEPEWVVEQEEGEEEEEDMEAEEAAEMEGPEEEEEEHQPPPIVSAAAAPLPLTRLAATYGQLLRSKGFVWLAMRPDLFGEWSQVGADF